MTCKLCRKKPVWKFTNKQQLCSSCFVRYFEAKVRKTIRKYKMPIHILKGRKLKAGVINNIVKDLQKRKGRISEESLDDISSKIILVMMSGKSKELGELVPRNQPLYFLSDKEILLYAKLKKIKDRLQVRKGKLKKEEGRFKEINDFLSLLEKKNPDIRQNIVQGLLKTEIN